MLEQWNENEITRELNKLQYKPSLLVHYVESVRQRLIEKQDVKTAAVRIAFLEKQVNLLRLGNEYEELQKELALRRRGFDNEVLKIDLENQNIRLGFADEAAERKIKELENERRIIEQELELTRLKKQLDEIKNPRQPVKQPSAEEAKESKRQDIKSKIQRINEMIVEAKNDASVGESERQSQINRLERKKFDLNEELLDLI